MSVSSPVELELPPAASLFNPVVHHRFKQPCNFCRRAKRPCKWEAESKTCNRCSRLKFICPGSTAPPTFARRTEKGDAVDKWLQSLNIAPSSPAQTLPATVLATALVYDLVKSYRGHLEGVSSIDPDLTQFRLDALKCNGQISGLEDLIEIRYLIYLVGGAKLSRHSAIIGRQHGNSEINSFSSFERKGLSISSVQARRQIGLSRQSVLEDLTTRLITQIENLIPQLDPDTVSELFSLTWIGIRELGAAGVDRRIIRRLIERYYPALSAVLGSQAMNPDKSFFIHMLGLINSIAGRDPSHVFHLFLSKYDPERFEEPWSYVVAPALLEPFDVAANSEPPLPLRFLSNEDLHHLIGFTANDQIVSTTITKDVSDAILARQRTLTQWLVYVPLHHLMSRVPLVWSELERVEEFLTLQSELIWDAWRDTFPSDKVTPTKPPAGLSLFVTQLVKLHSGHLLYFRSFWASLLDFHGSSNEIIGYEEKYQKAICSWVAGVVRLMEWTTEAEGYELGITITQTLTFIKSTELAKWSSLYPRQALRLIRVLDYLSVALPNGAKLREILSNSATEELEIQEELRREAYLKKEKMYIAQGMVGRVLERMTLLEYD